jgi:peptidoglycan/LPS O-acetylase OafA/YrhL
MHKNNNLDIIRLILALSVMIFHGGLFFKISTPTIGSYAVKMFLIISGYLITTSYENSSTVKSYLKKRFFRLYPALIFLLLFCVIVGFFITDLSYNNYFDFSIIKFLFAHITLLNFLHPNIANLFTDSVMGNYFNGSLWTLKIELYCYLLIPMIYKFSDIFTNNKERVIIALFASFVGIAVIYPFIYNHFLYHFISQKNLFINFLKPDSSIFVMCGYFFAGALLKKLSHLLPKNNKYFFFIFVLVFILQIQMQHILTFIILPIVMFYIGIVPLYNINLSKRIGDLSYGIYIWHFPIFQLLLNNILIINNNILKLITGVFITIIFSFISWHLVEKQFLQMKK